MKIQLRSGAQLSNLGVAYGFGRVYRTIMQYSESVGLEITENTADADLQVCLCHPEMKWKHFPWWAHDRHKRQVIYTMWETTALPEGWVGVMNECLAVFVPSNFCREVFIDNGVTVPVYVVPHGVDVRMFHFMERDFFTTTEPFTFLWQGMNRLDRKGCEFVEQAFAELQLPEAWLVEKVYPVVSAEVPIIKILSQRRTEIREVLSREDYVAMLQQCHVSVNPYRGEGFGLMPLECAATGMATILTNWSGPKDYINTDCFRPLQYRLCAPGEDYIATSFWNDYVEAQPGQDALPDIEDLKDAMRFFYENRAEAKAMGERASAYVHKNWTWAQAMLKFKEACEDVLQKANHVW